METERKLLTPIWPDPLAEVDIVKVRFVLDFLSPCAVQPSVFLGLGRMLRVTGRQLFDTDDPLAAQQWKDLFHPALSEDPVALKKIQKPAPPFVVSMPITGRTALDAGDRIELEVLFIGIGITSIHCFLRCLVHLGHLGLVAGEGQYEVTEVVAQQPDGIFARTWRQDEPYDSLVCPVQRLTWSLQTEQMTDRLVLSFKTPTRLMVNGAPLRKPRFSQIFPFMLRRVTSMISAHCKLEVVDEVSSLLEKARELEMVSSEFSWVDWRALLGQSGMAIGGFVGEMKLRGDALEEIYWVLSVAQSLGIGKGATYGAGHVQIMES